MKPDLTAKSSLARLMAAENLNVEVNPKAPTAAFNLMNRTLILPLWEVGGDTYDMLVGHEVSHAIYTPGGWALHEACESISKKHSNVARDYINVVEDARIERLIKSQFPGLRRSFAEGYRELKAKDLFKANGKDLSKFGFLDRINLHYKIGYLVEVPFSAEELPLARRVAETKTWDEVVALSKEIYEFAKEQEKQEKQEQEKQKQEPQKGNESPEGEQGEESEQEPESGESESGESESEGSTEGEESENESDKGSSEGEEAESEDGEDGGAAKDSGGDETSEANKEFPETADEKSESESEGKGTETEDETAPSGSETAEALSEGLKDLAQQNASETVKTVDLPKWDRALVVPFDTIESTFEKIHSLNGQATAVNSAESFYVAWKTQEAQNVQSLWTEFERKKAADKFQRTTVAPTGRLDPLRLAYHKVSDDIFKSYAVTSKGKNHGFVLFLDMSASMDDKLFPTMIQLANLASFCRRANLPFKVYGFHETHPGHGLYGKPVMMGGLFTGTGSKREGNASDRGAAVYFRLFTLLESGLSQPRFQKQLGNLLQWAATMTTNTDAIEPAYRDSLRSSYQSRNLREYYGGAGLSLMSTPTTTALMLGVDLVSEFKAQYGLQVVNTIVLTDGQATDQPLSQVRVMNEATGYYETVKPILRDPVTRREYRAYANNNDGGGKWELTRQQQQSLMAQILRDRTGGTVLSIMLVTRASDISKGLSGTVTLDKAATTKFVSQVSDEGWGCVANTGEGYSHAAVLMVKDYGYSATLKDRKNPGMDRMVVEDLSKRSMNALAKGFMKTLSEKKTNRALMVKIADIVSKNLK